MREIVTLSASEVVPDRPAVLAALGPAGSRAPSARLERLLQEARERFSRLAAPAGLYAECVPGEFALVYRGAGENDPEAPLGTIYPRATHLALYAATVGEAVSREIDALFAAEDYPLAVLLDAAASAGAEAAGRLVQARYRDRAAALDPAARVRRFLAYSPGYCGWHTSGQRALFAALLPETVGITLNPSCLMLPLKSVSGVIVGGPAEIHRFADGYEFCATCRDHECRARIESLAE